MVKFGLRFDFSGLGPELLLDPPAMRVVVGRIAVESHPRGELVDHPLDHAPERILIRLTTQKGVFGFGDHSTTRILIAALQEHIRPDDRVLDIGTGSGVLAIAAARLGAPCPVAVDVDSRSAEAAREAVLAHGLGHAIDVHHGTAGDLVGEFDLVVANVGAGVLALERPAISRLLRPGGRLLTAIPRSDSHVATSLLEGFTFVTSLETCVFTTEWLDGGDPDRTLPDDDPWIAVLLRHEPDQAVAT